MWNIFNITSQQDLVSESANMSWTNISWTILSIPSHQDILASQSANVSLDGWTCVQVGDKPEHGFSCAYVPNMPEDGFQDWVIVVILMRKIIMLFSLYLMIYLGLKRAFSSIQKPSTASIANSPWYTKILLNLERVFFPFQKPSTPTTTSATHGSWYTPKVLDLEWFFFPFPKPSIPTWFTADLFDLDRVFCPIHKPSTPTTTSITDGFQLTAKHFAELFAAHGQKLIDKIRLATLNHTPGAYQATESGMAKLDLLHSQLENAQLMVINHVRKRAGNQFYEELLMKENGEQDEEALKVLATRRLSVLESLRSLDLTADKLELMARKLDLKMEELENGQKKSEGEPEMEFEVEPEVDVELEPEMNVELEPEMNVDEEEEESWVEVEKDPLHSVYGP